MLPRVGADRSELGEVRFGRWIAVWVLGCWAPMARLVVGPGSGGTAEVAVAIGAAVWICVLAIWMFAEPGQRRRRVAVLVPLVPASAIAVGAFERGHLIPLLSALAFSTLSFGALVRWNPWPGWPQRTTITCRLAIAPLIATTVVWYRHPSRLFAVLTIAIVLAALECSARAPATAARIDGAVQRLGSGAARGLSTLLSTAFAVTVLLPIWLLSSTVGHSPLSSGWTSARTAWVGVDSARHRTPHGAPVTPGRTASKDLSVGSSVRRRSAVRLAVLAVPLCIAAAVLWRASAPEPRTATADAPRDAGGTFAAAFEEDPAFEDAPWARDLRLDLLDSWNDLEFSGTTGWRLRDGDSDYIDIADGERRTTQPAAALGEPVVIWFFGGSVAFGAGQRDEYTIPSALVRLAGDDGVPITVRNFGVPATVNWQSTALLIEKLAWSSPPDLIVFYDGSNDMALQGVLESRGAGASDRQASLFDAEFDAILRTRGEGAAPATDITLPHGAPSSPEELGQTAMSRYAKGVTTARAFAAVHSVPIEHFWQPELANKEPLTEADLATLSSVNFDRSAIDRSRAASAAARAGLAALGVTDLTTTFDRTPLPIYWDAVHTNEEGAGIAADAVYAELRDQLRLLMPQG